MTSDITVDLFPFIGQDHPFYVSVEQCTNLLLQDPRFQTIMDQVQKKNPSTARITMKIIPLVGHQWSLKRICLSFQEQSTSPAIPFQATTFFYSGRTGRLDCFEFPQDPCLSAIPSLFRSIADQSSEMGSSVQVLRYVPRRRLTFRAEPFGHHHRPVIGKHIRAKALQETYGKMQKTFASAQRARQSFSIAAPRGIDSERQTFYQDVLEGTTVSTLIDETLFPSLLASVGGLHQELHQLEVPDVPDCEPDVLLRSLPSHMALVTFFFPEHKAFFDTLLLLLLKNPPLTQPKDWVFCHGDFSCNQILFGKNGWAIVDFDECLRGDPYFEMAMFLASLPYHIPLFQHSGNSTSSSIKDLLEEATESYLQGYEDCRHQFVDRRRLLWYRLYAEIIYVTRTLRRNLYQPHTFEQRLEFLRYLGERLQTH